MRKWLLILAGGFLVAALFSVLIFGRTNALDQNRCLSCHGDPNLVRINRDGTKISLYVKEEFLNTSSHRFIDCTTCHDSDPHKVITPLDKVSLAEKCGSCHKYQYELHRQSIHGEQLALGNPDVATCVDCHSPTSNPHNVIRVLEYNAPTYKKNIAQTCAKCHSNEELMASYGIVEKVYDSYMRSFHGKAIQLGTYEISQLDKATCINCHGTHDIKRVDDPNSPVAGAENLAETCEQCHEGAGVEFAKGFLGHKEASPKNSAVVFFTEKFFFALTASVVSFAVVIVGMAGIRWGSNRWKE